MLLFKTKKRKKKKEQEKEQKNKGPWRMKAYFPFSSQCPSHPICGLPYLNRYGYFHSGILGSYAQLHVQTDRNQCKSGFGMLCIHSGYSHSSLWYDSQILAIAPPMAQRGKKDHKQSMRYFGPPCAMAPQPSYSMGIDDGMIEQGVLTELR